MAKKSVAKNYLYNLVYQVLIVVLPLITAPYISRVLGPTNIGIYTYTYNIVSYFMLFGSLGVALYGKREIAYLQNNEKERNKMFWEIVFFKFLTVAIATVAYVGFFLIFGKSYNIYYTILLLELLGAAADISWYFQGLEEFKKTVTRNIIVRLAAVTCIFVFIKNENDLIKYTLIYSLGNFLGNACLWVYVPKYLKGYKIKDLDINIYKHFVPLIMLFIPQITEKIYNMMDTTMLGKMIKDKSEVGFYEQAQKIIRILNTVVASLGIVMVPRMATLFAEGGKEKVVETLKKSFRYVFFISMPIIFGVLVVVDQFIPVYYGPGYEKTILLIKILTPIIFLMGIENVVGAQYLIPTKQQKKYTIAVLVGLISNIILNFFLILKWQAIGASIATVVSQIIVDVIQLYYVRKEMNLWEMFRPLFKYLIFGLMMYGMCILVRYLSVTYIHMASTMKFDLVCVALQVVAGCITYFVLLLLNKDSLFMYGINRITSRFKKA